MNWIRPVKRLAIYMRDGFACQWCEASVEGGADLTLDHFLTRSRGGGNAETNLITCCRACNDRRRDDYAVPFAKTVNPDGFQEVIKRLNRQRKRKLDLLAAKELIASRGFTAAVQDRRGGKP